jgi:hypothetical protein
LLSLTWFQQLCHHQRCGDRIGRLHRPKVQQHQVKSHQPLKYIDSIFEMFLVPISFVDDSYIGFLPKHKFSLQSQIRNSFVHVFPNFEFVLQSLPDLKQKACRSNRNPTARREWHRYIVTWHAIHRGIRPIVEQHKPPTFRIKHNPAMRMTYRLCLHHHPHQTPDHLISPSSHRTSLAVRSRYATST